MTKSRKKKSQKPEKKITYQEFLEQPVNVDIEKLRKFKPFFGIPCYGGMVGAPLFRSFVRMSNMFTQYGVNYTMSSIDNESLVTRARNTLLAHFLADQSCTHLFFIDADIDYKPEDVFRMLHWDKDVVCGAYPKKGIQWRDVSKAAQNQIPVEELEFHSSNYVVNMKHDDAGNAILDSAGNVQLLDGGTGFMCIKRDVLIKMTEHYRQLKYKNDMPNLDPAVADCSYSIFDTMHDPDTNRYLSEDYTFCRRWQKMGGEIWLDPRTSLNHWGGYCFRGNVAKLFNTKAD